MKYSFFNNKIQEITSKNKRPWDLMNCVKRHKLPTSEIIVFNERPYIKLDDL